MNTESSTPSTPLFQRLFLAVFVLMVLLIFAGIIRYAREQRRSMPKPPSVMGDIGAFSLTERSGRIVQREDLRGKVWIADFIFINCAGPCPLMTSRMAALQKTLTDFPDTRLVSFSVDPERDTPQALTEYAEKFQADKAKWIFLTGDKTAIYTLIQNSFLLSAGETTAEQRQQPGADVVFHSTKFALVDKRGRLRGLYDSEQSDQLDKLVRDVGTLLAEKH